jgi:hypothetical protein
MSERHEELSLEMRRFNALPIAKPFTVRFLGSIVVYELVVLLLFRLLLPFVEYTFLLFLFIIGLSIGGGFYLRHRSPMLNVPLAVNMNHPFMSDAELGNAMVMVQFSDGTWADIGVGRVRLTTDELMGGALLIRDDDNYTGIGHFSNLEPSHPWLKRYVILINQAIALRDAVNGDEDTIEDARNRESIDYGLLERSWLEVDENLEIEPDGIFSKLRRD